MSSSRRHGESDPSSCLEIFRRALELNRDDAWERLMNGCIGALVRGKLLTHPAWPAARRHQAEQDYLTETFARFWNWRAHRLAAGQPVTLDSFAGLVSFLHRCLHSAILEELRFWAPLGSWNKENRETQRAGEPGRADEAQKAGGEGRDAEHRSAAFQGWPSSTPVPREPQSPGVDKQALDRERVDAIWACARGEREQRIFVLRWRLGYPPSEIAARWPRMYPGEAPAAADISQTLQNILARYWRQRRAEDAGDRETHGPPRA